MPPYWMRNDELSDVRHTHTTSVPFIIATNDDDEACQWPAADEEAIARDEDAYPGENPSLQQRPSTKPPSYRRSSSLTVQQPVKLSAGDDARKSTQPKQRSLLRASTRHAPSARGDFDLFHVPPVELSQTASDPVSHGFEEAAPLAIRRSTAKKKTSVTKEDLQVLRNVQQNREILDIPDIQLQRTSQSLAFLPEHLRNKKTKTALSGACPLPSSATLPYSYVYVNKRPLPDPKCIVFIPSEPVEVTVVDAFQVDLLGHDTDTYTYALKFKNGQHEWYLRKQMEHWKKLHEELKILQNKLSSDINRLLPGFVVKASQSRGDGANVARFHDAKEKAITPQQIPQIMETMSTYLKYIADNSLCLSHPATKTFMEAGPYSLIGALGMKMKEGYVSWRISDVPPQPFPANNLCGWLVQGVDWVEMWLVVKETYIFLVNPYSSEIAQVLLADRHFSLEQGLLATGEKYGLFVRNSKRLMALKCRDQTQLEEFIMEMTFVKHVGAKAYTLVNLCGAFAPVRHSCWAKWLVEGGVYYEAVLEALLLAKEDIFIADYWLMMELYLGRGSPKDIKDRLDNVLAQKAGEGVYIFILLCSQNKLQDMDAAVFNGLRHNLEGLGPPGCIQVMYSAPGDDSPWIHKEKLVVVDQTRALVGSIRCTEKTKKTFISCHQNIVSALLIVSPSTNRIRLNTVQPRESKRTRTIKDSLDLVKLPRSQIITSDPFLRSSLQAEPGTSISQKGASMEARVSGLDKLTSHDAVQSDVCPLPVKNRESLNAVRMLPRASLKLPPVVASEKDSVAKADNTAWDEKEFLSRNSITADNTVSGSVRAALPMPIPRATYHSSGVCVVGDVVKDLSRHFMERWNYTKTRNVKEHAAYRFLIPKVKSATTDAGELERANFLQCRIQAVRSLGQWSGGYAVAEDSIHQTLIRLITQSQHFIYIETETFISLGPDNGHTVNLINRALCQRIVAAYKAKDVYRVYVILPLLAVMEEAPGQLFNNSIVQSVMAWTYQSISRGAHSLIVQLSQHIISQYIGFFGLRKYEESDSKPMTEMIHNHSEVVLVDDRIALIGSASLCDRSLLGSRNSELACVIEDDNYISSTLNGRPWQAGAFCTALRWRLMSEHLGLMTTPPGNGVDREIVRDPVSDSFWRDVWLRTAQQNTSIYERVFGCLPSEEVSTFAELEQRPLQPVLIQTDAEAAHHQLTRIRGQLVMYPHGFLRNELHFGAAVFSPQGPMASTLWT